MKLRLIYFICLLSYITKSNAQNKPKAELLFEYSILSKKTIQGENLFSNGLVLVDSTEIQKHDSIINNVFTYKINTSKVNIKICGGWSRRYWYRHSIEIENSTFLLDSLWYGNAFTKDSKPIFISLEGCYYFKFDNKKYLVLFISDLYFPTTSDINKILLLFDVSEKQNPKFLRIEQQACNNLNCFGDFNNDNQLDYASWNTHSNRLYCYSLVEGRFRLKKNYFLFIKAKDGGYWISKDQSRWFFKIE